MLTNDVVSFEQPGPDRLSSSGTEVLTKLKQQFHFTEASFSSFHHPHMTEILLKKGSLFYWISSEMSQ